MILQITSCRITIASSRKVVCAVAYVVLSEVLQNMTMHPTLKKNLRSHYSYKVYYQWPSYWKIVNAYCFHAQGFSNPLNVSREVAALTTENLTPTDVSAATFIVEQLTQEAVRNSQVMLNCMLCVSGIMLYNMYSRFLYR